MANVIKKFKVKDENGNAQEAQICYESCVVNKPITLEEAVTLSVSSWSEISGVEPFTVQQSIPLTQEWGDANIAMYIQGFNGIADGVVLNSVSYSVGAGCYVGVFYAVSTPTTDVTVRLVSVGGAS